MPLVRLLIRSYPQFVTNPIQGTLSDSIGRRPIFLLGAVVNCAAMVVMGLVPRTAPFLALWTVLGAVDGSGTACNSIIVDDAVGRWSAAESEDGTTWATTRALLWLMEPRLGPGATDAAALQARVSAAFSVMWTYSFAGFTVGAVVGGLLAGVMPYVWLSLLLLLLLPLRPRATAAATTTAANYLTSPHSGTATSCPSGARWWRRRSATYSATSRKPPHSIGTATRTMTTARR